ncbi:MAG: sugar ABC transporter ATP-binding protein [Ruminiclostridium sp.]
MEDSNRICLLTKDLTKIYGGTVALHDANLDFVQGEIHALCGENGAGKSTLCKMLSGAITPDRGTIIVNGKEFSKFTPKEAMDNGIGMIYQEFNLVNDMPIYENLFLGKEIRKGAVIDRNEMIKQAKSVFDSMEIEIDPRKTIAEISVAYCQLVEIGKSLLEQKKILIMDEPTAPLTNQEVDVLFGLVRKLKERGITIIYISHRMEEILDLTDRVTVMRDGAVVKTLITKETNTNEIIRLMIGREASMEFPQRKDIPIDSEVALSVKDLKNSKLKGISFDLHKGEILGLAGLVGAGRTETARAIFGADTIDSGTVAVFGKPAHIKSPKAAIEKGIALIPEDRKRQGVHLDMTIRHNSSLVVLEKLSKLLTISAQKEKDLVKTYIDSLSIKLGSMEDQVNSLSGGNQQKVVLAKWLTTQADILIFDEPTRGIDVGAKSEIYELMDKLRAEGKAILMISSEMHEIIGMCNRVIVLYEGEMMGALDWKETTETNIMEYASGIRALSNASDN